jgi:hypothetical protein
MLNPPLSNVPTELLCKIVEALAPRKADLDALSLVDRAFTSLCQPFLIEALNLPRAGNKKNTLLRLEALRDMLEDNPSISQHFHQISIAHRGGRPQAFDLSWIFVDPTLMSVVRELGVLGSPLTTLKINTAPHSERSISLFRLPDLAIRRLVHSPLSESVTTLTIHTCQDIPAALFLVFPNLNVVDLDLTDVGPDCPLSESLCRGHNPPKIEELSFRLSSTTIGRLLKPSQDGRVSRLDWSHLRSLSFSSHEEQAIHLAQKLLELARETIEVIDVTHHPRESSTWRRRESNEY